ncbi:hypothetical protein ACLKA7_016632 [Drosophila subpalustris]
MATWHANHQLNLLFAPFGVSLWRLLAMAKTQPASRIRIRIMLTLITRPKAEGNESEAPPDDEAATDADADSNRLRGCCAPFGSARRAICDWNRPMSISPACCSTSTAGMPSLSIFIVLSAGNWRLCRHDKHIGGVDLANDSVAGAPKWQQQFVAG